MNSAAQKPSEDAFENPFTPEFVSATAKEFKVDAAALAETLAAVAEDFREARRFSRRLSTWREAKDRFQDTHRLLERALKSWRKGTQQTKDAFAGFFGPRAATDLEEHLNRMINQLDEIIEFGALQRGNPGKAYKTRGLDMHDFRWSVQILDEFWQQQKEGRHLGHGFHMEDEQEEGEKRHIPKHGKFVRKSADGDAGLLFAHKCLKKLESRITRSNVSSCIRQSKKPRRRG